MNLLDFLQSASNAAAGNVSGPVDLVSTLLNKLGVPVRNPVGGSDWMKQQGLMRDVPQSASSLAGETAGLLGPLGVAAKAPQIASGLLKAGENAAIPRQMNPQMGAIVYHGSPHKFDKFDSSKIGTGEGAQAYGHGMYFAESPTVARQYQMALSQAGAKELSWRGQSVGFDDLKTIVNEYAAALPEKDRAFAADSMLRMLRSQSGYGTPRFYDQLKQVKTKIAKNLKYEEMMERSGHGAGSAPWYRAFNSMLNDIDVKYPGNLYKVDLPDEAIAKMLDWDKPLSQQAPEVRSAVQKIAALPEFRSGMLGEAVQPFEMSSTRGETVAHLLERYFQGDRAKASGVLKRSGIPGIRYLDGGSRGAGTGTSNYVVFPGNEDLLKILERR